MQGISKSNAIYIFLVDFHGRIYQMKGKVMFFIVMYHVWLLGNVFAVLHKSLTVRWLFEKRTLLRGKARL